MAVTASKARALLFPLIEQVYSDQEPLEIVSKKGTDFRARKPAVAKATNGGGYGAGWSTCRDYRVVLAVTNP